MEVLSRQMQIHGRVREVSVSEEELNRPRVGARFQQMGRVRVPQRMRGDAFVDPGFPRGQAHGFPNHLRRDRCIGTPTVLRPWEQIGQSGTDRQPTQLLNRWSLDRSWSVAATLNC